MSANPPSLDGSAKNGCGYCSSCSVTLSTVNPSDVIVVGCNCWPVGGSFSVTDTAGLLSCQDKPDEHRRESFIQTWYAVASTPLSSDVISVKTPLTGETWYGVIAFGVSGANTQAPFDPNPSIPRSQANLNCPGSDPCNMGVSTTDPDDFVFQFGGDTGYTSQTPGAGFTLIQYSPAGQNTYAQYERLSNPISSATLAFGTSQGAAFGVIADAIEASASASNPTSTKVAPNPATVSISSINTFTATVKDTSSSPSTPTGLVSWIDGGAGGNFGILPQCTLIPSGPSSAACSIAYTAPSTTGSPTITATYSGDFDHSTSSGTSAVTVTASGGGDWTSLTFDTSNSRYQASSTITSANVGQFHRSG